MALRNLIQYAGETARRIVFAASGQSQFWRDLQIKLLGVDVGASYYPNPRWFHFLQLSNFEFVAIDPNDENLNYLDTWRNKAATRRIPKAISGSGGVKTLYKTNVDSGSSLYKPNYVGSNLIRLGEGPRDYLFPFEEKKIDTSTLIDAVQLDLEIRPITIKLDVQGAELDILKGAESILDKGQVILVEVEASLLTNPLMLGSTKFFELESFMREKNFDLIDLKPIFSSGWKKRSIRRGNGVLNECDAVYALDPNLILRNDLNFRKAAFMTFVIYGFQEQAVALAKSDTDLRQAILSVKTRNLFLRKIQKKASKN